ncbi:MAG: sigma-70 family RNA polymerase sigma factor [Gemmataceae bacterium]|nr:sigma-70 family RNA polymerase sigma factor [Gemmataceae bacterium]MCI0742298.1 sigma-70 family RNA polymerase sigma factor [Gemmataceae bacterium]
MTSGVSTCWTVIQGAAAGQTEDREHFARRYAPVLQAYLAARWRGSPLKAELDDAVQEVFLECFKQGGVLQRVDRDRPGGFRPFLYGVLRNVALRTEAARARGRERQPESSCDLADIETTEASLSQVFERAWAQSLIREAAERQAERATQSGEGAQRRVELLRLRFHEGLPIREIAQRWQADPADLHHEYARARQEFKAALLEVVGFHQPGTLAEIEQASAELLASLG